MVPRGGLQHEVVFGSLQLCPQVVVLGSDLGDPLLTVLQKLQLGTEAWQCLKTHTDTHTSPLFLSHLQLVSASKPSCYQ